MKFKPIWMVLALLPTFVFAADSDDLFYVKLYNNLLQGNNLNYKEIALPKVHPDFKLIQQIKYRVNYASIFQATENNLPTQVDLGMNKVPVLDQGPFGTCVAFATTAALDAQNGQGDYYSQLCMLNLGKYLKLNGFGDSGWEGEDLFTIVNRAYDYGLVSIKKQKELGCGGGKIYPLRRSDHTNPMSIDTYHQLSEPLPKQTTFLHYFKSHHFQRPKMDKTLEITKRMLSEGTRVIIGMYMPSDGNLGLDGSYKQTRDTWILSDKLQQRIKIDDLFWEQLAGHAMVIIGYDDKALLVDSNGKTHLGVFKARNSWSKSYGDHGDFYITYDYFKTMVGELVAVR